MAETSTKSKAKKGLGRGLGAFFDDVPIVSPVVDVKKSQTQAEEQSGVTRLKIRDIEPNPDQPRKNFDSLIPTAAR